MLLHSAAGPNSTLQIREIIWATIGVLVRLNDKYMFLIKLNILCKTGILVYIKFNFD
jgi:hypothetical protein